MKKIAVYFLIFLPYLAFGQLFPKVPDFRGNIRKVIEKKYGREVNHFRLFEGIYRPAAFSGWKFTYEFGKNAQLVRRTETFRGKLKADYEYQYKTEDTRLITREIASNKTPGHEGDYLEYENFLDQKGRIEKVNYRSFNARGQANSLYLVEKNAQYQGERLAAFTRQLIDENGDTASTEICKLYYEPSGKLEKIERSDVASGFKTVIYYYYDALGRIDHYSVDLLTELREMGKNQVQDIYFRYDRQGNWTRMYGGSGKLKHLEAKRRIFYQ